MMEQWMKDQLFPLELTKEYLETLFRYDVDSGILYWKYPVARRIKIEEPAGTLTKKGYTRISIKGNLIFAHKLVWILHGRTLNKDQLDHINGNRQDNRIENLREASFQENSYNSKKGKHNTSGYKGVFWNKKRQLWEAQIWIKRKHIRLGAYTDILEAAKAYETFARENHKEFYRC